MNWKVFLTASVSLFFISFPQNMIGCGGSEDPYDYYTSFFNKNASEVKGYQPFYYTSLLTFYDDWIYDQPVSYEDDKVISEWIGYCKASIPVKDAADFIYKIQLTDIESMLEQVTKNKVAQLPDSIATNAMTKNFLANKDAAALGYIAFAKQTEAFAAAPADWDAKPERDSAELNTYIVKADKLAKESKDVFIKNKYAYQQCKLGFYNNRFSDCIKWCDETFTEANTDAVKSLAISYKAGSLFRIGKKREAAYSYSKAFALSPVDKKKKFLGFLWATDQCNKELEDSYASICKNNEEKAIMLSMFGLYGVSNKISTLQKVYSLNPGSPLLDILAIREINKLEEEYLTPLLNSEKGGKAYYLSWSRDSVNEESKNQLIKTVSLFETIAADKKVINAGLYFAGAAYAAFMNKDYPKAKRLVAAGQQTKTTEKIADQLRLINLLTTINESTTLGIKEEADILPALNWLEEKAKKDEAYQLFYRNLFSEIIAQKYQSQKDYHKGALSLGVADNSSFNSSAESAYGGGIEFVRNEMNTAQITTLYDLMTSAKATAFERFIIGHSAFSKEQVIDVMGTSYLRDFNFPKAIEWLKKSKFPVSLETDNYSYVTEKETHVNVDPFHDYLNDWNRYDKSVSKPFTKLTLAQKLLEMQASLDTIKVTDRKAKAYYQLGSAFYNMSYYGNSWMAVAYDRSTNEWNTGVFKADWEKEYFGVYKATEYYQKAYELATDKEFKAAALFLVAKCKQRQIPLPPYNYNDWNRYEEEMKKFQKKFMNNALFSKFKQEFEKTKFYKYASNRCSYLRDFVNKK